MMLAELENLLSNLGDEIPKEDVQKLLAELCDAEDEDGELKSLFLFNALKLSQQHLLLFKII